MSIILENQVVKANIRMDSGVLALAFADDPSFIRSESVLVDLGQRCIGIIFENAYHHIGDLPANVGTQDLKTMTDARLTGTGSCGRELELRAPIKIVRKDD